MSVHRASDSRPDARPKVDASEAKAAPKAPARTRKASPSATPRTPVPAPRSTEEAEERYVAARDAWIAAMHKANSGRSADLASLAITQEAYEQAMVEVEKWRSGAKVAIPIEPEAKLHDLATAIRQELAWRRVHERLVHDDQDKPPGRSPGRSAGSPAAADLRLQPVR